jgi:hypothetical protein
MSSKLAQVMPVMARHEGVWEGMFRRLNPEGQILEAFKAQITVRYFPDERWPEVYHQTNRYFLPDGKITQYDTMGGFKDGKLVFESARVIGWSLDDPTDIYKRNALMFMDYVQEPGLHVYEIMQISDCNRYRTRMAQFLKDGRTFQRTLIDEERLTTDWAAVDREWAQKS